MIRRRRPRRGRDAIPEVVRATEQAVAELVGQMKALRRENARLSREVERLSKGWEQIRQLARAAPRRPRQR